MAGETTGANRSRKPVRRKIVNSNDRSTDRIYASGNPSAVARSQTADGKIHRVLVPPVPVATRIDDKSTDQYYAENRGAREIKRKPKKKPEAQASNEGLALVINSREDIFPVLNAAVLKLLGGAKDVNVSVKDGETDLFKRTRAAWDARVARQQVTEDQGRDVRIAYAKFHAIAATPPVPETTVAVSDDDLDPEAFLSGALQDELDPLIDTAAVVPVEVVEEEEAAPEVDAAIPPTSSTDDDDDDDDDDDGPAAKPVTEVDTVEPEAQPAEPEAQPEEAPKEESVPVKSRKGGRGTKS